MRQTHPAAPWLVLPLVLTAFQITATWMGWSAATLSVTALGVAAAWLVFAWKAVHGKVPVTPAGLADEEEKLMAELRTYVEREVAGTRGEVERTRTLVRAAVSDLNQSFSDLEGESRAQGVAITGIVGHGRAAEAGSPGMREFAAASERLMGELAAALADNSQQSVVTVSKIDEMAGHIDAIFDLLRAREPVTGTPAGAMDGRVHERVSSAREAVGGVRAMVEKTAEHGMDASVEAKLKADALRAEVDRVNRSLADAIQAMSVSGRRIHDSVGSAVRSLQFEDIVTQALTAAETHLNRLQAINQDALKLQSLLTEANTRPEARIRAMEDFLRHLKQARENWAAPARTPVSQVDMKPGAVELF